MPIHHPQVPLVEKERLGGDLWMLTFRSEKIASGLDPGRFVHIRVSSQMDPLFRRAMSVHSCRDDRFSILFRTIGRGTKLLAEMPVGDALDILGPLGNTFDPPAAGETAIMVAGGTGVPPLHFLTERLLGSNERSRDTIAFLCGISSADDRALGDVVGSLGVALGLSSDDGSVGHKGFVTDLLMKHLGEVDPRKTRVYSCGPDQMLRVVSRLCSQHRVRCQVSLEGNMPCGIGTCLGCVVPSALDRQDFRRICSDGPVFNSDEVEI